MTDRPDLRPGDPEQTATLSPMLPLSANLSLGRYRLLHQLGEGGIGEVWLAEQTEPVRRQVALKVIKAGMDTTQVVARFAAERQALALMDHPAIAQVFDAGATPQGRPYFVMEYVRGEPITAYCNRHKLSVTERIGIFRHVCEGVQHAHQKGIIHRDLKPSNVLVTVQDNRPVPKIIDFGIAKATTRALTDSTLYTEVGAFVGTPEYMSPEQAEMTGLNVDTRTDVYALGVILYQLLTGALPFGSDTLRGKSLDDIRRIIREVDPPRPSARVAMQGAGPSSMLGDVAPSRLAGRLRGDLDWITMKALDKDRTRRYGSASDLAADLVRHQDDQPVLAGAPTTTYRIGKFVRRHRGSVAAACGILAVLAAGLVGTTVGLVRARRAEAVAHREAQTAQRVIDLMTGMFEVADPNQSRGETITVREVLDRGVEQVKSGLDNDPAIKARLLNTVAQVFLSLGLTKRSVELYGQVLALQRSQAGTTASQLAQSLEGLGIAQIDIGNFPAAQASLTQALSTRRAMPDLAAQHRAVTNLATAIIRQGRLDEARQMTEDYLRALEQAGLGDSPAAGRTLQLVATIHTRRNELREAKTAHERAAEILRPTLRAGDIPSNLSNLAVVYYYLGDFPNAERMNREVLAYRLRRLGSDHPMVAYSLDNLGEVLFKQGRFEEAREHHARALEIEKKGLGETPDMGLTLYNLGVALQALGKKDEAERWLRESLRVRLRFLEESNPDVAASQAALGRLLVAKGQRNQGVDLLRKSLATLSRSLGPQHPETMQVIAELNGLERVTTSK